MPQPIQNSTLIGNILHNWTVREYERHERGQKWYIFMAILGILLVVYGMKTGNFIFSLIIILAAIIMYLQHHQEPNDVEFQIAELGVLVGSRFYPYTELSEFYIIYNPPEIKTLFIESKSALRPTLRVFLNDENPVEIRQTLRKYLSEDLKKEEEPMTDTLARRWKIH